MAVPHIISGTLAASISDHLPQFLVAPNIFFNVSYRKDLIKKNPLLSSNRNTEKFYKV